MIDGKQLTIHEVSQLLKSRQVSSCELTRAALEQIQKVEPQVKAIVTITEELAIKQAKQADERIARGEGSPLNGIPALIKDVICTRGVRTTCSSEMLENFVPPYDATVMEKLNDCGVVVVGNCPAGQTCLAGSGW